MMEQLLLVTFAIGVFAGAVGVMLYWHWMMGRLPPREEVGDKPIGRLP